MPVSPTLDQEVAFISGVNADNTLAQYSWSGWDRGSNSATYNSGFVRTAKYGATTAGTAGGTVTYYFDPPSNWTTTEQQMLASGLALWAAVANISFVQTTDSSQAQIFFTRGTNGASTGGIVYGISPGSNEVGSSILGAGRFSTVTIDTTGTPFGPITSSFTAGGGFPIENFLHEEGHALGLGHAGPYDGSIAGSQQYSAYDTRLWSVMSYFAPGAAAKYSSQYPVTGVNWAGQNPTTWMPLDILAIQRLYGVAANTPLSGGQTFGFNSNIDPSIKQYFDFTINTKPVITIWDKGTGNTLDLSGFGGVSDVNLNAGTFSSTAGMKKNIAIAFGTSVDTLVCSKGNNTVTCNNDGDTVLGQLGNDVFNGGSGNDVLNGGGGTNVVDYSGNLSDYNIISNADGTVTVSGNGAGTDTLSNIQALQFSDQELWLTPQPPPNEGNRDFDGNGNGDILLANSGNTAVQVWLMNGTTKLTGPTLNAPTGTGWKPVLTADFDGDGRSDILWQNTSTTTPGIQIWTMNGTTKTSSPTLSTVPGTGWTVVAAGDLNGDRDADIVLQNGSQVQVWLMNGATITANLPVSATAPAGFAVVGTGDFNGDGNADILWQNSTTGELDIWQMNGTTLVTDTLLGNNPGPTEDAITTGDFNGDGKSDILLQDTATGQTAIWLMDGTTVLPGSGNVSSNLGTTWKAVGSADYNGDGLSDILFRKPSTGALTAWMMSGTTMLSGGALSANPGTAWHAVAG